MDLLERVKSQDFTKLMSQALSLVPDSVDRREGSIIYDALAPACYCLAEMYENLYVLMNQVFVDTATGDFLERKALEFGIERLRATSHIRKIVCADTEGNPAVLPLGTVLQTVDLDPPISWTVNKVTIPDVVVATCNTAGVEAQNYAGSVYTTNFSFNGTITLGEVVTPGRDEETDSEMRARVFTAISAKPFGGNLPQYQDLLHKMDGVGFTQVYPAWQGGGTVKISVVDTQYKPVSAEFQENLKNLLDPETQGHGLGLVPIGHQITISTPTVLAVNVTATIIPTAGFTIPQLKTQLDDITNTFIQECNTPWGEFRDGYHTDVITAKLVSKLLDVKGVSNVRDLQLNGKTEDIEVTHTADRQVVFKTGVITWN